MSNTNITSYVSNVLHDVETVGRAIEVDFIEGVDYLTGILSNIETDISVGETILEVINPVLSNEVVAGTQIVSALDAGFTILDNISTALANPTALASDYISIKTDIQKAISIWNAQKEVILSAFTTIGRDAYSFKGLTQTNYPTNTSPTGEQI